MLISSLEDQASIKVDAQRANDLAYLLGVAQEPISFCIANLLISLIPELFLGIPMEYKADGKRRISVTGCRGLSGRHARRR